MIEGSEYNLASIQEFVIQNCETKSFRANIQLNPSIDAFGESV